jgi:starvation-inducible DNA-binding protein
MAITTGSANLPALDSREREEIGSELQAMLLELVDLSLIGKQLHWSVIGPLFRPLHLYLDELIDSWRGLADTVAERAVAVGFWPDGQAEPVAAGSDVAKVERGAIQDRSVLSELVGRVAEVSQRARERMNRLAELDAASEDVLVAVVRTLEEQLWMIRAQMPHQAG